MIFPTEYTIDISELGQEAEARGFEALFFPEHTHIPSSRQTPYPGGGDLPKEYKHTFDPFVALSYVAARTTKLKLGTGICLVNQRDPIILAKQVASLDVLSKGRFLFGVGAGWNWEEMRNHDTNPKTRWSLLEERVGAMKEIWSNDEASYQGSKVHFDSIWSWPKPLQTPWPPVILGANGPSALRLAAGIADEWMPIPRRLDPPLQVQMSTLAELCEAKGRPPIPTGLYGVEVDAERLAYYRSLGVSRVIFWLASTDRDSTLVALDKINSTISDM